eukprot:gene8881-biopygen2456
MRSWVCLQRGSGRITQHLIQSCSSLVQRQRAWGLVTAPTFGDWGKQNPHGQPRSQPHGNKAGTRHHDTPHSIIRPTRQRAAFRTQYGADV